MGLLRLTFLTCLSLEMLNLAFILRRKILLQVQNVILILAARLGISCPRMPKLRPVSGTSKPELLNSLKTKVKLFNKIARCLGISGFV